MAFLARSSVEKLRPWILARKSRCYLSTGTSSFLGGISRSEAPFCHGHRFTAIRRISSSPKATKPEGTDGGMTMWQRFLAPKEMAERNTAAWYREMVLICTVFAITGSSTMVVRTSTRCYILLSETFLYMYFRDRTVQYLPLHPSSCDMNLIT
jgi:hypothetical protein